MQDVTLTIQNTLNTAIANVVGFLPQLVAGLIILIVGWIIAGILSAITKTLLNVVNIKQWFRRAGVEKETSQNAWINVLSRLVFWTILVVFLIPTFEAWNIPQINEIIGELILYLPKVFASVIIGLLGFVTSNLLSEIVANATRGYGGDISRILSGIAKYSIIVFTSLIVLTQLGIAPALIQTVVMGLVASFALATGLAFGLGGQDAAKQLLQRLMQGSLKQQRK